MHQGVKVLLIGSSLLFAAPAFAQGDGDAAGAGGGSAAAGGDATAAGGATTPTVAASADNAAPGAWSDQLINNPQTLPKGGLGAAATFQIYKFSVPPIPPATMGTSLTIEGLGLDADYGITDKITAGISYLVDLHDDAGTFPSDDRWKGPLDIHGAFNIIHKDKMSVTAGADFLVNLNNTDDKEIHAGLSAKYMLSPKLAVYTGNPVPIGPAGQHLSISLASNGPITFGLPVGVALQATPQVFGFVDTTLANLSISNSSNQFIFSDFIPVEVGALFRAAKDLDVGVMFSDDLKNAGDFYVVGLTARIYKH